MFFYLLFYLFSFYFSARNKERLIILWKIFHHKYIYVYFFITFYITFAVYFNEQDKKGRCFREFQPVDKILKLFKEKINENVCLNITDTFLVHIFN